MKRSLGLVGLGLLMLLTLPSRSPAVSAALHYFDCKQCHKAGMAIGAMGATNTCLQCHANGALFTDSTPAPAAWYDGNPGGRFNAADLNDLFGAATAALGAGTYTGQTHAWGVPDVKAAAGAKAPDKALYAGFYSRYNASTGKVTCSRCHNPHGDADLGDANPLANPTLLIRDASLANAPMNPDKMCRACHVDLDKTDSLVINTHPIITDYAAAQATSPNDLRTQAEIDTFTSGHLSKVQIANGGVGCVSCHDVHYTDSHSATADGLAARAGLVNDPVQNPGELLRSDGPNRTGPDRNTAVTGTAQLRSNLCQSCHKYELHGQGQSGDHKLGCLDCHNGHDPVGNPSDYMLRSASNGPVPTRPNRVNGAVTPVTFPLFTTGNSRTNWADEQQGLATGFCEACHGDCNSAGMISAAAEHTANYIHPVDQSQAQCSYCHKHNDPANLYSFNRDATQATCGQCHGFPPYKNQPGDRTADGVDGGYAVNNTVAEGGPYDYVADTTHEKDETKTGHKVHAGRDIPTIDGGPLNTSNADWYFVGASGVDNCKVCHGADAGSTAGGHRINPTTRPNTFRDIAFIGIATTGSLTPAYNPNSPYTCSNVYCHTNGSPYNGGSRPNRNYSRVNTTPSWIGNGGTYANGGYSSIYGTASRCAECHGNTVSTMTAGSGAQKSNSAAHLAHMGGTTTLNMGRVFDCSVCHVYTASSSTALAVNAMDGRDGQGAGTGGKHVNGLIDVNFDAVGIGGDLSTSTHTAATGVCSTYCHNVTGQAGAVVADWDNSADMQCDSCHGGKATDIAGDGGYGPISTDSHSRHILTTGNGPKLTCEECHGTGASTGNVTTHIDGVVTMKIAVNTAVFGGDSISICKECHGYEAGEVLPVWGSQGTTDCATCHSGNYAGAAFNGKTPLRFGNAKTTGHNRPTASGAYAQSANPAANLNCSGCHVADKAGHWDGTTGNDMMLLNTGGFPATYTSNADKNNFCGVCHGAAGTATITDINTHQSKLCVACHNVHGDSNIQMVWSSRTSQLAKDTSATGKYAADVTFTNITDFTAGNNDSYDEDDDDIAGFLVGSEINSDDICATCHTEAAGTLHNNSNNTDNKAPTGHKMGESCFPCHALHTNSTDAFKVGVGTACNDCHGFPPATGAHRNGLSATDPELYAEVHSNTASTNKDIEDRSDCAFCHVGADYYTYDLTADQASNPVAEPGRNNHAVSQANRRSVLLAKVGYNSTNFNCTSACHASTAADGAWNDTNGLDCNSCHYAAQFPNSAGNATANNSEAVSAVHNKHFDKNAMACSQCHTVIDSPGTFTSIRGPLPHVVLPVYTGPGNDGTLIQGRANATLDEATVTRTNMSYSGGAADAGSINNTCSGTTGTGFATGCHASAGLPGAPSKPDWDLTIPATSAGCVMCHTETTSSAYNPTTGVHNNNPSGPTVTGNAHDGSFDDGNSGTADCLTCHTASPNTTPANHINGTLNSGAAITVAAIAGYSVVTGDCATTCHSAGTAWRYKWTTDAYLNDNVRECNGCHGLYSGIANSQGWRTGTIHATSGYQTRGEKHNNNGTSPYPCDDCHANGSAGYTFAAWGVNQHGDNNLQLNNHAEHGWVDAGATIGCNLSCHGSDALHSLPDPGAFTPSTAIAGNRAEVSCSGCHGGGTTGDKANYWPDGANVVNNTVEDNSGAHAKHMAVLALKVYGETATGAATNDILRNNTALNPGLLSDTKQKELCTYCHGDGTNPIVLPHGNPATDLPAEVNTMYKLWGKTLDNGYYDINGAKTCATVDCHNNKTTPTSPDFSWYGNQTSTCVMCHVDVTTETAHTKHTSAATGTTFGRASLCADCHEAQTNWGSNTPPANGHLDNTFAVAGNRLSAYTGFTYPSVKGTCGTNLCHNSGNGVAPPAVNPTWGTTQADCTICHAAVPAVTTAHAPHLASTTYVPNGCDDCHDAASASTHLDQKVDFGGAVTVPADNTGYNGSCTNNCHVAGNGDWTGGSSAIVCTDCHSSTYVGGNNWRGLGNNYMPQYNMHTVTPVTSGKVHTDVGLGTTCQYCHSGITALGSHIDGIWHTDNDDNLGGGQGRGLFGGFTDAAIPTCSGGDVDKTGVVCHIDNGVWVRKWNANAANNNETRCANCHGYWAAGADGTGWRTGVSHAENPLRGSTSTHNDAADSLFGFECYRCHVLGGTGDVYHWANGTNDWATEGNTQHGDGYINMNDNGVATNDHNISGRSGCTSCHEGAIDQPPAPNTHDFPASIFPFPLSPPTLTGSDSVASGGGGCDGCHGGGGNMAPNGSRGNVWPDRPGKHAEHMAALTAKGITGTVACNYCHPYSSGSEYVVGEHNDAGAPATMPNATSNFYKRIIGGANDSNGITNGSGTNYVTCSNVDCHFEQPVTPHWYTDDVKPAAVTLSAVPGSKPRSIEVSWTAPGDDNNVADTTAYVYDLRMGTSAAISQNFSSTTNYAGNLPAAYKQGYASKALIQNLTPGQTYHFTLKTRDTAGNWSDPSNTISATPAADATAPAFGGANKAEKGDASQTVYLTWTPAEDHTMPITYKVWKKAESAGALDMDVDPAYLTGVTAVKGSSIVLTAADGLVNDTIYNFGVRACDANNNCDTNDQIVSATPTAEPQVSKTNHTYRTSTSTTWVKDGSAGAGVVGATLPLVFTSGANNTYSVTYFVDTFAVFLDVGNSLATVRATIGYSTNGTNFTSLGVTKDINTGSRADRVYQFKLVDVAGKTIPSGQRLAIQLSEVTATGVKANYGSASTRGDMTVAEQILNVVPTNPNVNATVSGANINVTWTASTDTADGLSDTVHYDLYGSDDNGTSYRYFIAKNIPAATTNYSWNTQLAGISGSATMAIKLLPGDGYGHYTGATTTRTGLAVNNSADNVAPGTITDLVARPRPKAGSVELTWTAQGDDTYNNGRAAYYDIRYDTRQIVESGGNGTTTVNFADIPVTPTATSGQCVNEPSPDFGGKIQSFEVTGLTSGTTYYFAIKTYDDGSPANASAISTAKSAGSDQAVGGPRCGMCHTTAPSIVESVGNHKLHGFTLSDCVKCHGAASATYGLDHQDGELRMGYGPGGPQKGIIVGNRIYYTNNGLPIPGGGDYITYDDNNSGFGGFGDGSYANVGTVPVDDGTCINFGAMGVGGCHSAAGTDPDGAGSLPTYPTPTWTDAATLNCAACHGNPSRTTDSFYGRDFDATHYADGDPNDAPLPSDVPDQIKGAPVIDNHGNYNLSDPDVGDRKFIGQHEKHLNYSFRFSKGDSCNLCHSGNYRDVNDLDGKHANGEVDVKLDPVGAGTGATWTPGDNSNPNPDLWTAGSCSGMNAETCHPSGSVTWDSNVNFDCIQCHGMNNTVPSHVTDPSGSGFVNDGKGNCEWCHFGGHPRDIVGGTALILPNSSQVGINYKSGGIHMKKVIGGRASMNDSSVIDTEAELCWGCHEDNSISEWGADTGSNNTGTVPPNLSNYDYGTVTTTNWTTATWRSAFSTASGYADNRFGYKTGAIQSTHSTNETGTSAVSGSMEAYSETKDTVDKIRCSNCHDVHNLNKAPNDSYTGQPYLRGTWIRNPYPEDGAPWGKTYAVAVAIYGPVPRAGGNEQGGYQIDQNNNYPTAGMSLATSAGLCTLCHGTNIDTMDKTPGENLWIGSNGHSNATLGGTASNAANIFGHNIGGRPTPSGDWSDTAGSASDVPDMALQAANVGNLRGYSYRNAQSFNSPRTPTIGASQPYAYRTFSWGVTVDAGTTDIGYHAFTCSKCHNPHASRLPKLMITNCLDTRQNTWQSSASGQGNQTMTTWTSPADNGEKAATWNTAQNCHRYDSVDNLGGWNKVTPW